MLVEAGRLGGTCLIRGCIPSKALIFMFIASDAGSAKSWPQHGAVQRNKAGKPPHVSGLALQS